MTHSNYSSDATAYGNQLASWRKEVVMGQEKKQLVPDIVISDSTKVDVILPIALGSVEIAGSLPI